ncbi:hypothetical protein BGZ65_005108 [Modicella reniformis]|uniref:Uncharacterized protein n=1 Tax=Modicella reniformis TaxID=1440133 RepID=A0A9P6ST17_9FUNG|nr:hypothetical protein BGZ65_005108 [Modicella reniformis]
MPASKRRLAARKWSMSPTITCYSNVGSLQLKQLQSGNRDKSEERQGQLAAIMNGSEAKKHFGCMMLAHGETIFYDGKKVPSVVRLTKLLSPVGYKPCHLWYIKKTGSSPDATPEFLAVTWHDGDTTSLPCSEDINKDDKAGEADNVDDDKSFDDSIDNGKSDDCSDECSENGNQPPPRTALKDKTMYLLVLDSSLLASVFVRLQN